MKKKLNCILLVDDDDDCNYFHKRLLDDLQCVEHIEIATDGQEALDFLLSKNGGQHPKPEMIFLDINMPVMDGWEFLEEYDKLDTSQKADIVLVMLTTSLNPDDKAKATKYSDILDFQNKLLTRNRMIELFEKHFPDNL